MIVIDAEKRPLTLITVALLFFLLLLPRARAPYLHNPINVDDVCRTFKDIDLFA